MTSEKQFIDVFKLYMKDFGFYIKQVTCTGDKFFIEWLTRNGEYNINENRVYQRLKSAGLGFLRTSGRKMTTQVAELIKKEVEKFPNIKFEIVIKA